MHDIVGMVQDEANLSILRLPATCPHPKISFRLPGQSRIDSGLGPRDVCLWTLEATGKYFWLAESLQSAVGRTESVRKLGMQRVVVWVATGIGGRLCFCVCGVVCL